MLLFVYHAMASATPSADSAPREKATDAWGWLGPHVGMGLTQSGFVTADNFCETVRSGFVANEQEIKAKFGEWFMYYEKDHKMVTKKNIVASLIENKQMLALSFSKVMKEPLSLALKEAIKEALVEHEVLTKTNFGEALVEHEVLTKTNFGEALVEHKVLTETNFGKALVEHKVLTETNFKSVLQTELERNKLYKLAIKDQLAIKVVQFYAFVLTFHVQHPRLGPLLRALPTQFCRFLCTLACPLLAAVLAGQTCAILARAATMQTPSDVPPAAP